MAEKRNPDLRHDRFLVILQICSKEFNINADFAKWGGLTRPSNSNDRIIIIFLLVSFSNNRWTTWKNYLFKGDCKNFGRRFFENSGLTDMDVKIVTKCPMA